jgi:hypothetical protein
LAGLAVVLAFAGVFLLAPASAQAQVGLAPSALPASGLAGVSSSTLTASSYPAGETPSSVTVYFSTSCMGSPITTATEHPTSVTHYVGSIYHIVFPVPASLTSQNYFVWTTGTSPSYTSTDCSEIQVTATSTTLAACVPTSSLGVVAGTNVNAYVPNGYWEGSNSGVELVPIEGSATPAVIATPGAVNSCAANSVTGEVVCTENTTNVDIINGSTLTTTLTSGSNYLTSFTGGSCNNCGVGINAANNTAVIAGGFYNGSSGSGQGVQVLNLATNTFNTPSYMNADVSEDISIDSSRNLILSPGEDGSYQLLQIGAGNTLTEYDNYIDGSGLGYDLDSAAEDCTTGIGLSADEFTENIYITDLTQATFTPGSPVGTWSAPGQFINLPGTSFDAGSSGLSTAPGTNHQAVVTGEFGGSSYAILQLPATSGTGIPTLVDWAYVSGMPSTPDGTGFSAGFDPHTVTAYTSPTSSKSFAVFADYAVFPGHPGWLGVVDMACVLALPRSAGTNTVIGNASTCTNYISVP